MSDSVGSVSVDVVPDARGWAEKLRAQIRDTTVKLPVEPDVPPSTEEKFKRKGKESGEKFSGEFDRTVSTRIRAALDAIPDLKIGADTTDAALKLDFLREEIKSLSDPEKIGLTDEEALAKIANVRAQLSELAATSGDIRVNVDALAAEAKLAEVQAMVDRLNGETATTTVRTKTEKSLFSKAAGGLDGFLGKLGLIPALAITASSALIPLAGTLGGIAAALAAPLAIAGGGVTLFGFLAGFAVKNTEKQLKQINTLDQKLSGLKKGTAEYAKTQKELKAAQDALTPAQQRFAKAQDSLKGAFQGLLQGKTGQALLGTVAQGMGLLAKVLPDLAPVITSVGGALSTLLGGVGKAVDSPGFKHFIALFANQAGVDILGFGRVIGGIAKGLGGLFLALDKSVGHSMVDELVRLAHAFSNWSNSDRGRKAVQDFVGYFHKVGPEVGRTIGAIARAIGHIAHALAPLGPVVLHAITLMADGISKIPVPVLTALAGAFAGMVAFQKLGGFKGLSLLGKLGGGISGAKGGGGISGAIKGIVNGGVQKVYVVNMPPGGGGGGLPGGGGGKTGLIERAGKYIGPWSPSLAALGGTAAAAALPVGFTALMLHENSLPNRYGSAAVDPNIARGGPAAVAWAKAHQAQAPIDVPHLTAVGTKVDALRANLGRASQAIDLIGPHANNAFGMASRDVENFTSKLNAIHDKRLSVILQDQAAIQSLERLQAMRIADKNFNIYAHYQAAERGVGPGGGMGHPAANGGGSSGGAAARVPVNIHLDASGQNTLSGYMHGAAQNVYDQNQQFQRSHG